MAITAKDIGLTDKELQTRVVSGIVESFLHHVQYEDDTNSEYLATSPFGRKVNEAVKTAIDEKVQALAELHIIPKVDDLIEDLVITKTNDWGEATGEKWTLVEYLVKSAETYMIEEVDMDGKSKEEVRRRGRSFRGKGYPRISYLVDKNLRYAIEVATEKILKSANEQLVDGLKASVEKSLKNIVDNIKVQVKS